jgi:putative phosphoesterase
MPRVALIADTHMPRRADVLPPACLAVIARADVLVHAGDVSEPGVLAALRRLCPRLVAVRGNVDVPALRAELPETVELDLPGLRLGVVHDAGAERGRLARLARRFPACDAVVFGHSHIPLLERGPGLVIVNPGSPTDPRRQPRPSMAEILIEDTPAFRFWAVDGAEPEPLPDGLVRGGPRKRH